MQILSSDQIQVVSGGFIGYNGTNPATALVSATLSGAMVGIIISCVFQTQCIGLCTMLGGSIQLAFIAAYTIDNNLP